MAEAPDPNERRKRPNDPFDDFLHSMGFSSGDFERMFEEMQRSLSRALQDMGNIEPGKPYVHGFSFKIGPDGKPRVTEFGNRTSAPTKGRPIFSEEREPVTDVIEDERSVAVTLEIPGVEKKDINLHVTEHEVEISVDTEKRKYHKLIKLPTPVKPETTNATYKNGILDVSIQKAKPSAPKKGFRVDVK